MPDAPMPDTAMSRSFASRDALAGYLKQEFPHAQGELSQTSGGAIAARHLLEQFSAGNYAASRNFLRGEVSRLSPYLRHGVLTLSEVRRFLAKKYQGLDRLLKFIQELAWRDYWQRIYAEAPGYIWNDVEPLKTGKQSGDYKGTLPPAVEDATTGLACMDAFVTELNTTGYLHNHARMWFAAYLVHWCGVSWKTGARFFLSHLLDGDPASNNLSWQWIASTFSSKPYIFNRENLEHYSGGIYCQDCPSKNKCPFDRSYEELTERLFPLV